MSLRVDGYNCQYRGLTRTEHLRSSLLRWHSEALRLRHLRVESERSLIERNDRLLADKFSIWLDRTRERRLLDVENEVATHHEDALMFAIWDKWKARSTVSDVGGLGVLLTASTAIARNRFRQAEDPVVSLDQMAPSDGYAGEGTVRCGASRPVITS